MSLRTWSHRACIGALVILLAGCGGGSTTSGSNGATGTSGGNNGGSNQPVISGVSTPKSVSVVTAN